MRRDVANFDSWQCESELDIDDTIMASVRPAVIGVPYSCPPALCSLLGIRHETFNSAIPDVELETRKKAVYFTQDGREWVNAMRAIAAIPECDLGSRLMTRPEPCDKYHDEWHGFSLHQKLCWYWSACNISALAMLEEMPGVSWLRIDLSSPDAGAQVCETAAFIGVEGITGEEIDKILAERAGNKLDGSDWRNWSDRELEQFWEICAPAMERLGYFTPSSEFEKRWSPDYGKWWMSQNADHEFFERIYKDRLYQHERFYKWARPLLENGKIQSVLEIGCGHGLGYVDFFKDIKFTGIDISPKEIDWCQSRYTNSKHDWRCCDFIREGCNDKYDLVFCQGTIENVYDMDGLIKRMCEASKKYVYLAGWYGFHDEIDEHKYTWNAAFTSYSNIFSINKILNVLSKCNFMPLVIEKIQTGKQSNPTESLIVMERSF